MTAFSMNEAYSYVACDATDAYHPEKCELALRQFVFLPPDMFVVMDRVNSTKPEYEKTWLLHTATEPEIDGTAFSGRHEGGRLFGRTVLPANAGISKVGGPGNQFRAGGANWPIPSPPDTHIDMSNENPLFGQWRLEVTPEENRTDDHFLHLLRVDDRHAQDLPAPSFSPPKDAEQMRELSDPRDMVDVELLDNTGNRTKMPDTDG